MQDFTRIMIIILGYLLGLGFVVSGMIGLKKVEKEFRKSNCDVSEIERKKCLPYLICTFTGFLIPLITSIIVILIFLRVG